MADPKFRQVVPMRFFNLTLTPAEAEACSADYLEEKSPRGSVARVLLRIVAVVARMTTELEELKRAENSPSLWKLHADSLVTLLEVAATLSEKRLPGERGSRRSGPERGRRNHQDFAAKAPPALPSDCRYPGPSRTASAEGVRIPSGIPIALMLTLGGRIPRLKKPCPESVNASTTVPTCHPRADSGTL